MKTDIIQSLATIQRLFEAELIASIKAASAQKSPYGYALLLGEDLEMAYPIAVTNCESDLADPTDTYSRYIPDEWLEWHDDHFAKVKHAYKALYQVFSQAYTVTDGDFCYTEVALEFMEQLYGMYLAAMKKVIGQFPDVSYWIIWISDSDRPIISESFWALNSDHVREEAAIYFEQ